MSYSVYKHTSPNGKVYIGITKNDPEIRWAGGAGYRRNKHFYKAIKKHGWDAFKHEVLFSGLTKEEACAKEVELIEAYKSSDPKNGYNNTLGGECNLLNEEAKNRLKTGLAKYFASHMGKNHPSYGKHPSQETRAKMSNAAKGRRWSDESKAKLSASKTGHPVSDKARKALAEASRTRRKAVKCIETGRVYKTLQEASADTGVSKAALSEVCHGKYHTAGGFHWKFDSQKSGKSGEV